MDKQYLKQVALYVLTAVLSVLLILYIGYHLLKDLGDDVETVQNQLVTVEQTLTLDGYIMRDETVLYSPVSGGISCLYDEGEKVSAGTVVANIYSGDDSSLIRENIMSIDQKITLLENSNIADNILVSDTNAIDRELQDLFYTIRLKVEENELDYALRKTDAFLTLLNKRQVVVKTVAGYDDRIRKLNAEKLSLTAKLENISATVKTASSGYFYSKLDGYEEIFSSRLVDSMTVADFDRMTETDADVSVFENERGIGVGKIVSDYYWYAACEVTAEQLRSFDEGKRYEVIFPYNNDRTLTMELYRVIAPTDSDRAVLILRCNRLSGDFNFLRCQTLQIVEREYTGYKVPVGALRVVDGVEGVYVLEGNIVEFRTVEILYEIDGNFIVAEKTEAGQLDKLDTIISKGKDLYEGKIVD